MNKEDFNNYITQELYSKYLEANDFKEVVTFSNNVYFNENLSVVSKVISDVITGNNLLSKDIITSYNVIINNEIIVNDLVINNISINNIFENGDLDIISKSIALNKINTNNFNGNKLYVIEDINIKK